MRPQASDQPGQDVAGASGAKRIGFEGDDGGLPGRRSYQSVRPFQRDDQVPFAGFFGGDFPAMSVDFSR